MHIVYFENEVRLIKEYNITVFMSVPNRNTLYHEDII